MGIELPPESYLASTPTPVLIVEVTGADREEATNIDPPLVSFRVLEVLHGDVAPGEVLHAFWEAWTDPFYAMRGGGDGYSQWMPERLGAPRPGEKWIVTGTRLEPAPSDAPPPDPNQPQPPGGLRPAMPAQGRFEIPRIGRVPATPEARERILAARKG